MHVVRLATVCTVGVAAVGLLSASAGVTPAPSAATSTVGLDHPRQNPYFPLHPGTSYHFRGVDEGEHLRETVTVTHRTKVVQGVRTRVVRDVLRRRDGSLAELTHDWYAADDDGTVWYFGERTATYDERGHLESREGSWRAGVDGARAGVIMPADPRPTDAYRQEFRRRHAEDQAWIVQRNARARTPSARYRRVVRSFEWSRLEPRVMSTKLYAPHVGMVRERDVVGGHESFWLVRVTRR
jgi:hypothetical protein